jgi:hypothetical protein
MLVTPVGITVFLQPSNNLLLSFIMMALQPLRLSYTVFPSATEIDSRLEHFTKAYESILVTLAGMVILVRLVHASKAFSQMVVKLVGSSILLRAVQSEKA